MPAEWRISEYLENSASSKYYSQVKELLNRGARACPGLLLVRLEWAWCCFLPEKSVLLFTQTKTKLILVTARGKTSEADLSPIKPACFFSLNGSWKAKVKRFVLVGIFSIGDQRKAMLQILLVERSPEPAGHEDLFLTSIPWKSPGTGDLPDQGRSPEKPPATLNLCLFVMQLIPNSSHLHFNSRTVKYLEHF